MTTMEYVSKQPLCLLPKLPQQGDFYRMIESTLNRSSAACLDNTDLYRQKRVFCAKERTIGIDEDALGYQVKERRHRHDKEANMSKLLEADMMRTDHAVCVLEHKLKREERSLKGSIVHFRQHFQQPVNRREFDLNDTDMLKKQDGVQMLPGLVGEDPDKRERLKKQQLQIKQWCLQQQADLKSTRDQLQNSDKLYDESIVASESKAIEMQKLQEGYKRSLAIATKNANLTMALEIKERELQEKCQEEDNNRIDIQNQLQGDLLCDNPNQSISVLRTPHVRHDFYKGMTSKQRIHAQQRQDQIQEEYLCLASARTALLQERQQISFNKQQRKALDNTNAQLAEVRRAREKWLEKEFTNGPTEGYFAQFNTSSR
ncbi:RIB43A-like with coiled-coils protein 2 isoform X2 [Sardina pilchardus]|uniref:RIB43A-like with coiled-coils protein 2 isoform X2 n=1 Tax=Sardina pilchardus TaxID=27697 RepID=UPI002E0FDA5C